ncbi:GNAT family N-acetyltransferase [Jannaschia pohangensis]|nr:GNAT family N-acetyltransferase [Jannaschia pohangensis]
MSLDDLAGVLDWAAAEGWNPGLDDAAAFFAADREGFFLKEIDGAPVAAVSVVNHSPNFAFLGLYLCRADARGQGFGMEVWRAGLAHAGNRCIGLEGVPAQQGNYVRSGFAPIGRTVRYKGSLPATGVAARTAPDVDGLLAADRAATGIDRARFARAWFTDTETRRTICLSPSDPGAGFATVRKCRDGVKIGPFQAVTEADAMTLLTGAAAIFGAGTVAVDVPETAPDLARLLAGLGFAPVFETASMYFGRPPQGRPPPFQACATLELG